MRCGSSRAKEVIMGNEIYLFGGGGLGREIAAMLYSFTDWKLRGIFDDDIPAGTTLGTTKVIGSLDALLTRREPSNIVIAVGDPRTKATIYEKLSRQPLISFPTLVHPAAIIYDRATVTLGRGSIISAGCVLTTGIRIGDHVLVNLNCSIGHDSVVGDYSSLMPGVNLAGNVSLQEGTFIGSGAQVINKVVVGSYAKVGSGAVVTKDVKAGATVAGVPARDLK